jgi:hypothetical protein
MTDGFGEPDDRDRDVRADTLRAMAAEADRSSFGEHVSATHVARSTGPRPRSAWSQWAIIAVCVVALLAVIGAVISHWQASQQSKPQTFAIDPTTLGLGCVTAESWAPNSAQVALVGTQNGCNASQVASGATSILPNTIIFFNALTGKRIREIEPDASVQAALKASSLSTPQVIMYQGAIWSRDGKRLALPFTVEYQTSAGNGTEGSPGTFAILAGLSVITVNSPALAVTYLLPQNDLNRFTGVWDLKTGQPHLLDAIPSNVTFFVGEGNLQPAALRYTWQPDGTLAASDLLNTPSATSAALSPVGNPAGDPSFTIWQPLKVGLNTGDPQHPVTPAPLYLQNNTLLAWSPDGNYVLDAAVGPWRVQPSKRPAPGLDQLKATFMQNTPLAPVRDAAFDTLLNKLSATASFAWSPDGQLLSAIKYDQSHAASLLVLDCTTGKSLATIPLPETSTASVDSEASGIAWSPDGKRLTLITQTGEMYIIGPDKLP